MIEVIIADWRIKERFAVDSRTTIRQVLDKHNVDYSIGRIQVDGRFVDPKDFDESLSHFDPDKVCHICHVFKAGSYGDA